MRPLIFLAALLLPGCFKTDAPDGAYRCRTDAPQCPSGYACALNGTCWRDAGGSRSQGIAILAGSAELKGSEDGSAQAARFHLPSGICGDGGDHLYVVDSGSNTIREVVVSTGEVSTMAGAVDQWGHTDAVAGLARFARPTGIECDGKGNLYIADTGNYEIRQIAIETRMVTTLAGAPQTGTADGVGGAARFYEPTALAFDGNDQLYVTDRLNHTVRRITLPTREVTTVAGVPTMQGLRDGPAAQALFGSPRAIALRENDLFVSDDNKRIRRIALDRAEVSTVTDLDGKLLTLEEPPSNMVFDRTGALYLANNSAHTIWRLFEDRVSVWAGGDQPMLMEGPLPGGLNAPFDLAPLPWGGFAVTDEGSQVVLLIR